MASEEEARLAAFLAKYSPEIARLTEAVHVKMQALLPGAVRMVYDNYNALAIGFGPTERASDAILSIAAYPRWVTLFFLHGVSLSDPQKLLKGSGKIVRSIVLKSAADLDDPAIRGLIDDALRKADAPLDPVAAGRLVIKSVSAKQRPRRPRT